MTEFWWWWGFLEECWFLSIQIQSQSPVALTTSLHVQIYVQSLFAGTTIGSGSSHTFAPCFLAHFYKWVFSKRDGSRCHIDVLMASFSREHWTHRFPPAPTWTQTAHRCIWRAFLQTNWSRYRKRPPTHINSWPHADDQPQLRLRTVICVVE